MSVLVKLCGFMHAADVRAAVSLGADFLGFVFVPSPRFLSVERAAELAKVVADSGFAGRVVGVFANATIEELERTVRACNLSILQLHGAEPPEYVQTASSIREVWKAIKVRHDWTPLDATEQVSKYGDTTVLLEAFVPGVAGSSGVAFDHAVAIPLARERRVVLAGGLTPQNVAKAVAVARPYAVDVCSGIESRPGQKDYNLMRNFVQAVRSSSPESGDTSTQESVSRTDARVP
jgi:phosphoribosylanthranilate isomerase